MLDYKTMIDWVGKYLPNPQAIQLNQWIDQLRKENLDLKDEIIELKNKVNELNLQAVQPNTDIPSCPNCSTTKIKQYLSPIPKDFIEIENATHECSKCGFKNNYGN
ncbi:hypothetical protein [Halarcobacter sp.]|uniref:hypothetical protein n=1 Tax=Halarcobacter sp. TaxID=2321133 RepID=UPI002AAAA9E2|nr:hypothetical protein [Halarcobacter sp.]